MRCSGVWLGNETFHFAYILCSAVGALPGISLVLQMLVQLANLH